MKMVLTNGRVITPLRVIENAGVVIENGRIQQVFEGLYPQSADEMADVQGRYISPGFFDLHTHGGGGCDNMDGTPEAVIHAAKTHMQYGTTSIMPTTMTSTMEELYAALNAYREAERSMQDGPNLLGVHLEGPYVSPARNGAQNAAFLREPVEEEIIKLLDDFPEIKRISAAPELPGGMRLGQIMRERGLLPSIGHSDAMYPKVLEACENGYRLVTHYYSGNSGLARVTHRRELGIIETAYLVDDLYVEMIADGIHLPPELLRLILLGKSWNRIILTTDSMRGASLPEGSVIKLGSLKNGQDTIIEGGVAMMMHRRSYGGSVCTTDRCVRTMYKQAGIPIEKAVQMITLNPAHLLGISTKGVVAPGMDADLCIFDDDIRMAGVMVGGKLLVNKLTETMA